MSGIKEPSCTPSKMFWLEVTGKDTLADHRYVLADMAASDDAVDCPGGPKTPLEASSKYQGRLGPILAVEIETPKQRTLMLQLEGDETISAPLITDDRIGPHKIKPPQRDYQDNLMVSVHPTLFCDAGELTAPGPINGYDEAIAAPLRTGWIYVFFRGRLWRELSVITHDDAAPVLRDTSIEKARKANRNAANDRTPTGPELDVIHLPARLLGSNVYGDVQLAFSETQWSWQYIAGLEHDTGLRTKRTRHARAIKAFIEGQQPILHGDWNRVDELASMRARDNPLESDVTCPGLFLHDVSGEKLGEARQTVITQRDAIESEDIVVDADYFIETPSLYPNWRHRHLQGEALPDVTGGADVYAALRGRHLMTLTLRDPLQAARHLVHQINSSFALMLALVDNVKKRPFGATAELFHNNFRRETLPDGSRNPLFIEDGWFDNRLDESDEGRLARTVYDVERRALRHFLCDAQAALVRLLKDDSPACLTTVLRDLFALETGNAVAGYVQTGPLLQALSLQANRADPLLLPQDFDANASVDAEALALEIARGQHPLGAMLLPLTGDSQECHIGDATLADLKAMVTVLEDRSKPMRTLEPNIVRAIADHQDSQKAPDATALIGEARTGAIVFASVAGEFSQWWLTTIQKELTKRGKAFTADINRIKGAFEGFAQTAVPGKTTVQLEEVSDSRVYIVLDVLDEQGNTLTSGAAIAAGLKVADADAFNGVVKHQSVKNLLHQATVRPGGLPTALAVFDVWNFVNVTFYSEASARQKISFVSALADLSISSAHLASLLPQRPKWLSPKIASLKQEAKWFTAMTNKINVADEMAEEIVRSKLQAYGWVTGMFTTALMVSDSVVSFANGRYGVGSAQLVKASGVATMTSSDLIAARLLTPVGNRAVQRSSVQATQAALSRLIPAAARWTGTVASGWVAALGFGIYVLGEAAYYRLIDDDVSEWLRTGPFSDDADEQKSVLEAEAVAYVELIKAMTPVFFKRIPEQKKGEWLKSHGLEVWKDEAESILTFASPAFAITGEPTEVDMELSWHQDHYRILGPSHAGGWQTETIASRSGKLLKGIEEDYDERRHAIDFMVGRAQLSNMVPRTKDERVKTSYAVKRLSLTFSVDVWQRESETYETQKVTHTMEDLDVEWQR